jgi:hypothetical protein
MSVANALAYYVTTTIMSAYRPLILTHAGYIIRTLHRQALTHTHQASLKTLFMDKHSSLSVEKATVEEKKVLQHWLKDGDGFITAPELICIMKSQVR